MNPDHGFFTEPPVTVEAMRWKGGAADALEVIGWIVRGGGQAHYADLEDGIEVIWVGRNRFDNRDVDQAAPGDWIVSSADGGFSVAKPEQFRRRYTRR